MSVYHVYGIPQTENGDFRLFFVNRKLKRQAFIRLLQAETENERFCPLVGK
jgi:hypothetical protein